MSVMISMIKTRKKQERSIITTHNLLDVVLNEQIVPIPEYTKKREHSFIVQPRGTIFATLKRKKHIEF